MNQPRLERGIFCIVSSDAANLLPLLLWWIRPEVGPRSAVSVALKFRCATYSTHPIVQVSICHIVRTIYFHSSLWSWVLGLSSSISDRLPGNRGLEIGPGEGKSGESEGGIDGEGKTDHCAIGSRLFTWIQLLEASAVFGIISIREPT